MSPSIGSDTAAGTVGGRRPIGSHRRCPDDEFHISLSVLMPSFNAGSYLPAAIHSALCQLMEDDELIVQDAESTDGSAEYLAALAKAEPRLTVMIERDGGQSDGLNRALARATNPWVIWLNADDLLLDSSLDALRDAVRCDPDVDLVLGAHHVIRADGSLVDAYPSRALSVVEMMRRGCAASSGSILMRADFLRSVGGFEEEFDTVMDLALQMRMAAAEPRQKTIPAPVGAFRVHESSKTSNLSRQFIRESHRLRMRYAVNRRQQSVVFLATVLHVVLVATMGVRQTSTYRSWRRRAKCVAHSCQSSHKRAGPVPGRP